MNGDGVARRRQQRGVSAHILTAALSAHARVQRRVVAGSLRTNAGGPSVQTIDHSLFCCRLIYAGFSEDQVARISTNDALSALLWRAVEVRIRLLRPVLCLLIRTRAAKPLAHLLRRFIFSGPVTWGFLLTACRMRRALRRRRLASAVGGWTPPQASAHSCSQRIAEKGERATRRAILAKCSRRSQQPPRPAVTCQTH